MTLATQIAAMPPGGCWPVPRAPRGKRDHRERIERAAAVAERKTGRLFKVTRQNDGALFVTDVSPATLVKPKASHRGYHGPTVAASLRRIVSSRSVVDELGGKDAVRALVAKHLAKR